MEALIENLGDIILKKTFYYIIANILIICTILLSTYQSASFAENYFSDTEEHWAHDNINQAFEYGLVNGYPDGTFRPRTEINKGQFIAILLRAINADIEEALPDETYWGSRYIRTAKIYGVVGEEYDESEENGTSVISRIEMVEMLKIAIEQLELPLYEEAPTFSDIDSLSKEQEDALLVVLESGVMHGTPHGTFLPYKSSTRAELATVFVNIKKAYDDVKIYGEEDPEETTQNSESSSGTGENSQPSNQDGNASQHQVTENLGAKFQIGDTFQDDEDIYKTYEPNSETFWKVTTSDDYNFYILNHDYEVIARFVRNLPATPPMNNMFLGQQNEYNYENLSYWEYVDNASDESIMIIELNPNNKKEIELAPTSTSELKDFEALAEYITNLYRHTQGKYPLGHSDAAQKFARNYAKTMADGGFFGHTAPDGTTFKDRITKSNLPIKQISENIAYNYNNPISVVVAWINSPKHKKNMLSNVDKIGIGASIAKPNEIVTTQILYTP